MQLTTERVRLNSREVKRIYFEAFTRRERMPFPLMVAMSWLWNTQFLSFAREGRTQGFVYLARGMGMVFVMFLAVDGELRGQGCGSAILAQVRRRNPGRRIVVTIEPCDADAPDLRAAQAAQGVLSAQRLCARGPSHSAQRRGAGGARGGRRVQQGAAAAVSRTVQLRHALAAHLAAGGNGLTKAHFFHSPHCMGRINGL